MAEYVLEDMTVWPAGVAYTHPEMGYQTVNLGFGIEFMIGDLLPSGHYVTGAHDRVDLMANIMEYFGKTPTSTPTEIEESEIFANRLGHPRPNPFNPSTTIDLTLATEGRTSVRIFNAAGRVVRTLLDEVAAAGPHVVNWDGLNDAGQPAASGVYFVRMEATGAGGRFSDVRRIVLLK